MGCWDTLTACLRGQRHSDGKDEHDSTDNVNPEDVTVAKIRSGKTNAKRSQKKPAKVTDAYSLGKVIGSGSYSVVRESVDIRTKEKVAIKCMKRAELTQEDEDAIQMEVSILKQMDHPNVMRLLDFFTEDDYYYLVTEFISGGELFDRIVAKTFYTEKEARDLVQVLLKALKYCHDREIVHRDLKPENLLLTNSDDDSTIKLADFGFAKQVEKDANGLVTTCGTPGYVAPEILRGEKYGKAVDVWSSGVITYILLAGYPPFHDDAQPILFRKIKKGKYHFDSPYWDDVSDDAKDFVSKMLVVDPSERATVNDLLEHKWIKGDEVAEVPLTSTLVELRRFHARKKFKAAVHSVQATIGMNKLSSGLSKSTDLSEPDQEADL